MVASGVVDRTALRFNQASIVALVVVGFLLDAPAPVVLTAAVLTLGTVWPAAALFRLFYARLLRPAGLLRPDRVAEDPAPHEFAQAVGAACLLAATGLFVAGLAGPAWALAGVVAVLAGVNLVFGFCLGCFIYFQLARVGLLGRARPVG